MLYGGYVEPIDTCECATGPCRDGAARERDSLAAEVERLKGELRKADANIVTLTDRLVLAYDGPCVTPNGRTGVHGEYARFVDGVAICDFCGKADS